MTAMSKFKIDAPVTTTDIAHVGNHVARVFGVLLCPHCFVRMHASAVRETAEDEYGLVCPRCHSDVLTITAR